MTRLCLLALTFLLSLAAGCSRGPSGPDYGGDDGKKIALLVDALIDDRSSFPRMTAHFAKPSAPSQQQWRKFAPYAFEVVGSPSVSGTTATAKVRIVLDSNREEKGLVEWSFAKEADQGKITSAPLP